MNHAFPADNIIEHLETHATRVERHAFAGTAEASLGTLLDILETLDWTPDRFIDLDSKMPGFNTSIGLATPNGAPYLLVSGRPAGAVWVEEAVRTAAGAAGFPFMVATDTKRWNFVDLVSGQMIALKDMIHGSEAKRVLAGLGSGPDAHRALHSLTQDARILEYVEPATMMVLKRRIEEVKQEVIARAIASGEHMDQSRMRSILDSAVLPTDMFFDGLSEVDAGQDICSEASADQALDLPDAANVDAPAAVDVPAIADIRGLAFGPAPKVLHGRRFTAVVGELGRFTLKAGSQIIVAVPELTLGKEEGDKSRRDRQKEREHARIVKAHRTIVQRGEAIEDIDAHGEPCLVLQRDVKGLSPSHVMYAAAGTSRNPGQSLYCASAEKYLLEYGSKQDIIRACAA